MAEKRKVYFDKWTTLFHLAPHQMSKYTFHFDGIDKIISASAATAKDAKTICWNGLSQSDRDNTASIELIDEE